MQALAYPVQVFPCSARVGLVIVFAYRFPPIALNPRVFHFSKWSGCEFQNDSDRGPGSRACR